MRLLKNYALILSALLVAGLFVPACKDVDDDQANLVKNYDHNVSYDWTELFLEVERYAAGYRPGPAPRSLAYMGLSAYEACITGMPEFNSMANLYPGLSIPAPNGDYHWPTVVNASYAHLMPLFFVNATDDLKLKMTALDNQYYDNGVAEAGQELADRSRAYGKAVTKAIWAYAVTDPIGQDHYLDPLQGYD